ncbi:hypothetical protein EVAR_45798_1 [Eumeta japonica]|uniref:Uncharacterized protein n=1 Tax=Eumeta variegata TaxID=151549 RepID=A0A4C1X1K5_EUMVA|nr:hypothetical protein EVAR_45798_1 [Eumeta japonica]
MISDPSLRKSIYVFQLVSGQVVESIHLGPNGIGLDSDRGRIDRLVSKFSRIEPPASCLRGHFKLPVLGFVLAFGDDGREHPPSAPWRAEDLTTAVIKHLTYLSQWKHITKHYYL